MLAWAEVVARPVMVAAAAAAAVAVSREVDVRERRVVVVVATGTFFGGRDSRCGARAVATDTFATLGWKWAVAPDIHLFAVWKGEWEWEWE